MSLFRSRTRRRRQSNSRRYLLQPLEARRVLAASLGWDGPGLGSAELTYYIANSPNSLSQAETNAAIETALAAWSSVVDISFTPTGQAGRRDSIDISFTDIDGVGGTLAQAYFPDDVNPARIAGDIQFDSADAWEVGNATGNRAFDLVYVAVHEIGHSLGLDHTAAIDSVLAPFVSPRQSFAGLAADDIEAIQDLYAAADEMSNTESPAAETSADDSTFDEGAADPSPADGLPADETPADETDSGAEDGDADQDPFPRRRWRRGGNWHRWGGRLNWQVLEHNHVIPTDVSGDGATSALDALLVINQLERFAAAADDTQIEPIGLCDTNGDGAITALDALTVINALANEAASSIAADAETSSETDGTIDDGGLVDDTEMSDDQETDDEESGDDESEDQESDDEESGGEEADDQEADDDGGDDEAEDCHRGHGRSRHLHHGLLGADAEALVLQYDTDGDSALDPDEVPERLWAKFIDLEVDSSGDAIVSLVELETAIELARQQAFEQWDADDDGLLVETEVGTRFWTKIAAADTDSDDGVSLTEWNTYLAESGTGLFATGGRPGRHHHSHPAPLDAVFASLGRAEAARLGSRHR